MRVDNQWTFVPFGAPLSLVGAAGAAIYSNVIDLLGAGAGIAPPDIIGNVTTYGVDFGMASGDLIPKLIAIVGTAAATANAATLNVAWQFAADAGAPTYQPGAWQSVIGLDGITIAQLAAGKRIMEWDYPKAFPANLRPRFTRLSFTPAAATNFTAGTILFAGVVPNRDDAQNLQAARNYSVQ